MEEAGLRDAVGAVFGVLAVVRDGDVDAFERELLALGVVVERHRRAAAEGRGEEVVGRWSERGAAGVGRLVDHEAVRSGLDVASELAARADDDRRRHQRAAAAANFSAAAVWWKRSSVSRSSSCMVIARSW